MAREEEEADIVGEHRPGGIKRMKLHNFLTHGDVEFWPGPRYVLLGKNALRGRNFEVTAGGGAPRSRPVIDCALWIATILLDSSFLSSDNLTLLSLLHYFL